MARPRWTWGVVVAVAASCGSPEGGARPVEPPAAVPRAAPLGDASAPTPDAPVPSGSADPVPAPPAAPPPYPIGEVVTIDVPGDRPVFVVHGPPGSPRAMLYLHGVCGNPTAFDTWTDAITPFGTLVSLLGDDDCKGSQRQRWSSDIASIDRRATAALRRVSEVRGEPLDDADVTLLGYSQGALRAELLAKRFPARYPRVILMGGPHAPALESLSGARAIVLMAGEKDRSDHLREAVRAFEKAGRAATFLEMPGARHGEYGPAATAIMSEAIGWAFAHDSPSP